MKKIMFSCLSMILTLSVFAQPTFDNSLMGTIGGSYTLTDWDATDFNPGEAGAGVIWDFSAITITGPVTVFNNVNPAATPYAASFGLATLAVTPDNTNFGYFQVTAAQYNSLGVGTPGASISYSNAETIFSFPLTYNTTNDDTFAASFVSTGVGFNRSGNVHMEADGYGTLILPSGTFTNVLRVKVEEDYSDESIGLPVPLSIEYETELYYWFMEGLTGPLFYYANMVTSSITGTTTTELGSLNPEAVVSIQNVSLPENLIHVFPNPATENLYIQNMNNIEFENIALYNMMGQSVLNQTMNNETITAINIEELPAGIYTLQLRNESGTLSKMISIE
ncbi:MAG: T9SS type A sorting domain-containing protein [Bacteroidetes bacterium]|nr:T9SS type A sorting domain-containing protein [Bacteroidota bacterium]MBP7399087.1 T9SS type A sorting domain-containing protein [Chitinophagales bacterium]MBP8754048.1 T9SS type A sorting domain-containing protein [Chitinophagales bacterium]MBP9190011.1 T9SS type A sorting domain-containing protein [Chitinophagales bacterium]MBP9704588.1 T9SS type A sorting domain-containing protein [Chitinophagales bacterium]